MSAEPSTTAGTPVRRPAYGPTALATPANALTLIRIAAAPLVYGLIRQRQFDHTTFWIWFFVCLTDGIDGYLARRQGRTRSGAFLDPLADKFLVLGAMTALVAEDVFWWPFLAIIAAREIIMSWYRSWLAKRGISLPARQAAKLKTLVQQLAVGFAIMPWVGEHALWVGKTLLVLATVLTITSGLQYAYDARTAQRRRPVPLGGV